MLNKYYISKDEFNALLYIYYGICKGLENNKGIAYKYCFKFQKLINENIIYMKNHNIDINDYVEIGENENVN